MPSLSQAVPASVPKGYFNLNFSANFIFRSTSSFDAPIISKPNFLNVESFL
jgi:hypothetical protein